MRNTDRRPRRRRPSKQPTNPQADNNGNRPDEASTEVDTVTASPDITLVNAPSRVDFERWLHRQENPERFRYIYRIEHLFGITDATILVIRGGNPQLLVPLGRMSAFKRIKIKEVTL